MALCTERLCLAVINYAIGTQRPLADADFDIAGRRDDTAVTVFLELIRFQDDFVVICGRRCRGRCWDGRWCLGKCRAAGCKSCNGHGCQGA